MWVVIWRQEPNQQILFAKPLMNGEETSEFVSSLYNELGPRIGSHLVESNVVITLAGVRGETEFSMHNVSSSEKAKIEKINKKTNPLGIYFSCIEDKKADIDTFTILNLHGIDRSSKLSKLPFVEPFAASSGMDGLRNWFKVVRAQAKEYFVKKNQLNEENLTHLMVGVGLGYPDQALLDGYYTHTGQWRPTLSCTQIPCADYYKCPEPNFLYLPEHGSEESIAQINTSWGKVLEEFYNSLWHRSIAKDSTFLKTRALEDEKHESWFLKKVYL